MLRSTQIFLWRLLAIVALVVGVIGLALPVLPTVPFVILAACAASKGWSTLEQRLLDHPRYGLHIRRWREQGAVPRNAKLLASIMMLTSSIALQFLPLPLWLRIGAPACMALAAIWLWRRPEPD
jgi:uncharacterized protein